MLGDRELRIPCVSQPAQEFEFAVSPHNHCEHSIENLASLNEVVKLAFMRPFSGILQSAFGLAKGSDLNYAEVSYRPPQSAEDVFFEELATRHRLVSQRHPCGDY